MKKLINNIYLLYPLKLFLWGKIAKETVETYVNCAMYLYSFEKLDKMFKKDSTGVRKMKMIKEHLKYLGRKK